MVTLNQRGLVALYVIIPVKLETLNEDDANDSDQDGIVIALYVPVNETAGFVSDVLAS